MALDISDYKFWSGAFDFTWDPGIPAAADPIALGTTERGFRSSVRHSTVPIRVDRFGDTVVDELYLGIESMVVTIESLNWKTGADDDILFEYANWINRIKIKSGDESTTNLYQSESDSLGRSAASVGGPLICTAVSGHLAGVGAGSAFTITFHKAVPLEPLDLLFSLRGPIRIPFAFRVYPTWSDNAWKYWTTTNEDTEG